VVFGVLNGVGFLNRAIESGLDLEMDIPIGHRLIYQYTLNIFRLWRGFQQPESDSHSVRILTATAEVDGLQAILFSLAEIA